MGVLGHKVPVVHSGGVLSCVGTHPGGGFWGVGFSSEPGICGAARFGTGRCVGRWDAPEKGARCSCMDLASAVPWREQGLRGARCRWLSPAKIFQPKASNAHSQRLQPAVAVPGSGAAVQLVQAAGLEPRGRIQPQALDAPSQPWHLCKAMALPSQILLQPPLPWRGEAWGRLLGVVPMFWGMWGRVWPSSCQGRQQWHGGDAVCVEPPFGGGPRRQVRGELTHLCCHGEFSPRHRETAVFPQNLAGSVQMLGFSWQWHRTGEHWGVPVRSQGASEQHAPGWKVKKMPP